MRQRSRARPESRVNNVYAGVTGSYPTEYPLLEILHHPVEAGGGPLDHPGWTPVGNRAGTEQSQRIETVAQFIRQLASSVADVADADQWAAMVPGVDDPARWSLRHVVPSWWLDVLDAGKPSTHEVSFLLKTADRQLGEIQLQSWKPGGFRPDEIDAARRAAKAMARLVAMVVPAVRGAPMVAAQ